MDIDPVLMFSPATICITNITLHYSMALSSALALLFQLILEKKRKTFKYPYKKIIVAFVNGIVISFVQSKLAILLGRKKIVMAKIKAKSRS